MRHALFFIPAAFALSLAGCASSTTTGVCARVSDSELRPEFAIARVSDLELRPEFARQPTNKSRSRQARSHHNSTADQASVLAQTKDDAPEPRPTSTEWWTRENARLGKAMIICRGCLLSPMANASLPQPAVRSSKSDLQALPRTSSDLVEGSVGVETQDRP
jgi:hypothetical protein